MLFCLWLLCLRGSRSILSVCSLNDKQCERSAPLRASIEVPFALSEADTGPSTRVRIFSSNQHKIHLICKDITPRLKKHHICTWLKKNEKIDFILKYHERDPNQKKKILRISQVFWFWFWYFFWYLNAKSISFFFNNILYEVLFN